MRETKKLINGNYVIDTYISLNEPFKTPINKLGQYEDIDESLEKLAKIKKALGIIKEDFFTFIDFKEEKREPMTGETITYYFIDFNRGDYRVYLPKEKWDLLKEILA